jgi:hypothetical protein
MHGMREIETEYETDDELWFPSVANSRYLPSSHGPKVNRDWQEFHGFLPIFGPPTSTEVAIVQAPEQDLLQLPFVSASGQVVQTHWHEPVLCQSFSRFNNFKVNKVAEALKEVDSYDLKTVVRVNGLRALGDKGLSIVARHFDKEFGSVKREVPVICHKMFGQHKPSNFGFIVMSCSAEAEKILAHDTFVVDSHKITVRAYAAKPCQSDADVQRPKY